MEWNCQFMRPQFSMCSSRRNSLMYLFKIASACPKSAGVRRGIDPGGFEREPHALRDERDAQLEIFHVGAQKLHDKRGQRAVDEIRMLEADGADKGRIEPQRPVQAGFDR